MGADLYLLSCERKVEKRRLKNPHMSARMKDDGGPRCGFYDEVRENGGYYRSSYGVDDVMWAMGLSWPETVGAMLDGNDFLPVERARELIAMIEARPLTKETLRHHYRENMRPAVAEFLAIGVQIDQPSFVETCRFLRQNRAELLAILKKSTELNEPLFCSI